MKIFHTYNIGLMIKNNRFIAVLFIVLLVSSEWGAKCEAESIPFVAEVGR